MTQMLPSLVQAPSGFYPRPGDPPGVLRRWSGDRWTGEVQGGAALEEFHHLRAFPVRTQEQEARLRALVAEVNRIEDAVLGREQVDPPLVQQDVMVSDPGGADVATFMEAYRYDPAGDDPSRDDDLAWGAFVYASLWRRIMAGVIDVPVLVVLLVLVAALLLPSASVGLVLLGAEPEVAADLAMVLVVVGCVVVLCAHELIGMRRTTLGRWVTGIEVIHPDGMSLGWPAALLRFFVRSVVNALLLTPVSALVVLFDKRNRALHDMVAGTVVVRTR